MKAVLIGLSLLLAALAAGAQPFVSEPLKQLEEQVNAIPQTPLVKEFRKSLPEYHRLLQENLNPQSTRGLHVDFILVVHYVGPGSEDAVAQSKVQAKLILSHLHPELIGIEGSFSENLTLEKILADLNAVGGELGISPETSLTEDDREFWDIARGSGVPILGLEEKLLLSFSTGIEIIDMTSPGTAAASIFDSTTHLRSEIALAELLRSMRIRGFTRGAVVFGGGHEADFKRLAGAAHLNADFYCAASEKPLSELTMQDLRC